MEALAVGLNVVCYDVGHIPHSKIHVCNSKVEMIRQLELLLNSESDYATVMQQTNVQRANKFLKLYNV